MKFHFIATGAVCGRIWQAQLCRLRPLKSRICPAEIQHIITVMKLFEVSEDGISSSAASPEHMDNPYQPHMAQMFRFTDGADNYLFQLRFAAMTRSCRAENTG